MGLIDENKRAKITITTSIYPDEMKLTIIAEEGALLNGSHVYVGDMIEPIEMNGDEFSIYLPEGEYDTELGFTGYGDFPIIDEFHLKTMSEDLIGEFDTGKILIVCVFFFSLYEIIFFLYSGTLKKLVINVSIFFLLYF